MEKGQAAGRCAGFRVEVQGCVPGAGVLGGGASGSCAGTQLTVEVEAFDSQQRGNIYGA